MDKKREGEIFRKKWEKKRIWKEISRRNERLWGKWRKEEQDDGEDKMGIELKSNNIHKRQFDML